MATKKSSAKAKKDTTKVHTITAKTEKKLAKESAEVKAEAKKIKAEAKQAVKNSVAKPARKANSVDEAFSKKAGYVILAELIGTFILTAVAVYGTSATILAPLYIGITLLVLFIALNRISGAHVNPAVTFGLWVARKVSGKLVPFYFVGQILGVMLAVLVYNTISGGSYTLAFNHIGSFDASVFIAELIATAVLLFGITAVASQKKLGKAASGLGIGLSLFLAVFVGSTLLTAAKQSVDQQSITSVDQVPRIMRINGVTANPAIALAATESTNADLQSQGGNTSHKGSEKPESRLGVEVIVATLAGGALGAGLFQLIKRGSDEKNA